MHNKPHTPEARAKIRAARARQVNVSGPWGATPWNKGLKAAEDPRVAANVAALLKMRPTQKKFGRMSEETKERMARGRRGDLNWAKRPEVREKIRAGMLAFYKNNPGALENRKPSGKNQFSNHYSSIEKLVAASLTKSGVPFLHNSRVGKYWVDFLIADRVVIECDGAYWHQDAGKDRKKDSYLHDRGYFVFRLSEERIERGADELVKMILDVYEPLRDTVVIGGHAGAAGFTVGAEP